MAYKGKFSQPRNTEENIRAKAEARKQAPVQQEAAPKRKVKKGNRNITIIFYTLYFLLIAAFLGGMFFLDGWLNDFLTKYEASQPVHKSEEVFQQHFADPDWAEIYTLAGLNDTAYEGADVFAEYMEEKTAGASLTYVETSAGLTGGRKYLLKLDGDTLGFFTLVDKAPEGAELPDWQLGQVSIQVTYGESILIQAQKGHEVTVNGVALTRDQIIRVSTTLAGSYLPEGVSAPTTYTYQVTGLMREPAIAVKDENGTETTVTYDMESGMYIEQTPINTIGDEESDAAMAAAETYAKYMIEEADKSQLSRHFDSNSKIYKTITSMMLWMQGHQGYEFANREISHYYRYAEDLFSARVHLTLNVTRRNGSVKEYTVDSTLFFKYTGNRWKVYEMTNVDVTTPVSEVRLTFMLDNNVLSTNLYESDLTVLTTPMVTPPEGKVFAGWFVLETGEEGKLEYTRVFAPSADGTVTLPNGAKLEPMTLYALFENAPEN